MNRLAVYGWDDQEPRLLNALQHAGSFTLAAVGDTSAAALVSPTAASVNEPACCSAFSRRGSWSSQP
ncbi:MAG: hypothetical protein WCI61_00035 [Chloroflexota bacterium]